MATKAKKTANREFQVVRYWPVEYRSIAYVQASSPEEAAKLALEDDDYDDQESCDGSDGDTEIGTIIEITPEGLEIEHPVPADIDEEMASASWCVRDIQERMPAWTVDQCIDFLNANEGAIQVAMIEAAGRVIVDEIRRGGGEPVNV
jgi:hypothetical protein